MQLMDEEKQSFFTNFFLKEWYFKKGFILIDIFIIIGLIQYFIFNGSFNNMINCLKNLFN